MSNLNLIFGGLSTHYAAYCQLFSKLSTSVCTEFKRKRYMRRHPCRPYLVNPHEGGIGGDVFYIYCVELFSLNPLQSSPIPFKPNKVEGIKFPSPSYGAARFTSRRRAAAAPPKPQIGRRRASAPPPPPPPTTATPLVTATTTTAWRTTVSRSRTSACSRRGRTPSSCRPAACCR